MVQEAPEADTALETAVKLFVTLYSCNKHNTNIILMVIYMRSIEKEGEKS